MLIVLERGMLGFQRSDQAIGREARVVGNADGGQDESAESHLKNSRGRFSRS